MDKTEEDDDSQLLPTMWCIVAASLWRASIETQYVKVSAVVSSGKSHCTLTLSKGRLNVPMSQSSLSKTTTKSINKVD